jgi:TonB family protein
MVISLRSLNALFLALVPFFAAANFGQNSQTSNTALPAYYGASERVDGAHIPPIPGLSFSAKAEVETTQTLPDGTTVTRRTFNTIARDFRGHTHNEMRAWIPADGSEPRLTYSILYDPDSHTKTYVYPSTHLARQFILKPPAPSSSPAGAANLLAPSVQKEDLGTDFQDGQQLTGIRETKTYPPGAIGNDRSLSITNEFWYSPDLHLNISVKRTDPRFGVQTVRITNLHRDEPDASLFEVPLDYRVVNENGPDNVIPTDGGMTPGQRLRVGGNLLAARLINRVQPVYPALARQTRIQGVVRLHMILQKDGTVQQLEVLSGHPLLVQAAMDAVRQWRYQPTLLNGEAVEVDTTVDVVFAPNFPPPSTP